MKLTLHVERLLVDAAVENGLVAADIDRDRIECRQHLLSEVLTLLFLRDRHLLNVPAEAAVVDAVIDLISFDSPRKIRDPRPDSLCPQDGIYILW